MSHASLASVAEKLVAANGRDVIFVKTDRTAGNSSEPWRGPAEAVPNEERVTAKAVFLSYTLRQMDGERIKPGDKQVIVAAQSGVDLTAFNRLVDGGDTYSDLIIERLKPGSVEIIYTIRARK